MVSRNPMDIVRIKDKLGVRSMASGECILTNTVGKLYGEEEQGMKIMLDMIALMRVYNAVSAIAGERRALVEAWQHLKYRTVFGKNALEHRPHSGQSFTNSVLNILPTFT